MKFIIGRCVVVLVVCVLGLLTFVGPGYAQDSESPATGFAMWVRFPVVSVRHIAASITGNPEFAIGYRGERFGLGAALGLMMVRGSDDFSTVSGTVFQIGPAGWIDFWESPDGMTRGNVALGVTFGKLTLTSEDDFGGKDEADGTLVNFNVGMGVITSSAHTSRSGWRAASRGRSPWT